MKISVLLICFSAFFINCFAQKILKVEKVSDYSTHIIGDNFEGVIFGKKYNVKDSFNEAERFTPTLKEISTFELMLRDGLNNLIKTPKHIENSYYSKNDLKYVKDNLSLSLRQYFGYFNKKHEKIICVSCFPKKYLEFWRGRTKTDAQPIWYSKLISVGDGGANYWRMNLNISAKKIFGFDVNGIG